MRFNILKNKKYGFLFSTVLVILSLFFLISPNFRLSMGIEFTGGTEITWSFKEKTPSLEEIENVYISTLGNDIYPKAIPVKNYNQIIVKSHIISSEDNNTLFKELSKSYSPEIEKVSTVGSSLGDYFKQQAFITLFIAIIAIILFLAWAFRNSPAGISSWRFGMSAIVALVHDVLIIAGVFAFLGQFIQLEIDTLFITALLTVLGFSVHDTIVVFDRIREQLKGKKSSMFEEIAEDSLWKTMGRSINTSVSTLFVLVAILIWGDPSLFAFVFSLAFGIFIGTYSSIFVATPILSLWVIRDVKIFEDQEKLKELEKMEGEEIIIKQ
jgi:preprotein translocase subunit SecF